MQSLSVSPQQAARELLRRREAKRSLLEFILYTKPDYESGWFHEVVCKELEQFYRDCMDGKSPRLMLCAPPRHGKSEIVSRRFPAWAQGKNPDLQMIGTSYGNTLAVDMCRDIQRVIDSDEYRRVFPDTSLSGKNVRETSLGSYKRTSDEYEIVGHTGRYLAAGVGQGITGKGADIGLIDDPVKDGMEADSPTIQKRNWEWYTKTFRSRISSGGGILFIGTRWNVNDLGGKILKEEGLIEDGGLWRVLKFPAIATVDEEHRKIGEPLHAERWPLSSLELFKTPNHSWQALYQQEPFERGETLIKRHWIKFKDDFPRAGGLQCRYWDLAGTLAKAGTDPDFTAGARLLKVDGQYFLIGMDTFRDTPLGNENRIRSRAESDGRGIPVYIQKDPGQAGKSQIDHYARNVLSGFNFRGHDKGKTSKVAMADPFSAACEAGNFFIVKETQDGFGLNKSQIESFLTEIDNFGSGGDKYHDDQIDAVTGAFDRLNSVKESKPRKRPRMLVG